MSLRAANGSASSTSTLLASTIPISRASLAETLVVASGQAGVVNPRSSRCSTILAALPSRKQLKPAWLCTPGYRLDDAACPRLGEVQERTDLAAEVVSRTHGYLSPTEFGTAVHTNLKRQIDGLNEHRQRNTAEIMTTVSQVREVVQPLLQRNPDLELVGRLVVIKPVHHILRGIYIDRSLDRQLFVPTWAVMFLFEPSESFSYNWGGRLYNRAHGAWDVTNSATSAVMC